MPSFDLVVESKAERCVRAQQLEGMFDVPAVRKLRHAWHVDMPIEDFDWQIGLIVGPSGSGKTQIARRAFGGAVDVPLRWTARPVIDDFDASLAVTDIADACMAVGFNTIPSWLKPFSVLSNGERFRVELARRLVEGGDLIVVDEFTSVVDRQVAKIASHAVQKYIRNKTSGKRFIAVTRHHDVIDWLRPDWVYDPSTRHFARGSLRQRPDLRVTIGPVAYAAWPLFAPYHYLNASLHRGARCWALWVHDENDRPQIASFIGIMQRPISRDTKATKKMRGVSRWVTLPDFQGVGLGYVLLDTVASVYSALGFNVHNYPAHPAAIHALDRSPRWRLRKRPGTFSATTNPRNPEFGRSQGARPCAVFRYVGKPMSLLDAQRMTAFHNRLPAARSRPEPLSPVREHGFSVLVPSQPSPDAVAAGDRAGQGEPP